MIQEGMQHTKWKLISTEDVSPSPWFPVVKEEVELPNGKVIEYFKSKLPDSAMVIPITKNQEIILVRQYKHGIGEICLEFPAGRIEHGESPRRAATHELAEETGIRVDEHMLKDLGEIWTEPSKSMVRVHCFLVTDVEITETQHLEETENIEIVKVPLSELNEWLLRGEIRASDSLGLIMLAKMKFPEVFKK